MKEAVLSNTAKFAEIAALAGDPARAGILHALLDGRALTAGELARVAGITPQTASGHLAQMIKAGLLTVVKQGRHRYHRLASPSVAQMMEGIMQVAMGTGSLRTPVVVGPRDTALRTARVCYDHLAGRLGVALADALVAGGHLELEQDAGLITESGVALLDRIGFDVEDMVARTGKRSKRPFCRPCLDWSERRLHLAGALGAALCMHFLARNWIRRADGTRAVTITPKGQQGFRETFGLRLP